MAYFKIGSTDFSSVCSGLEVEYQYKYNERENALGTKVIDYITRKRAITATIIPLDDTQMQSLITALDEFSVQIQYLAPKTKALSTVACKVEDYSVAYYTIQNSKKQFKEFTITFTEL